MEEDTENSASMEADNGQSFLEMELEALQSIYVNEVEVIRNEKSTSVSIDLHPATADKLDEQYVMMTLKFTLDTEYPQNIPEIHIRNPRGLSDEKLNSIIQDLKSIAESKIGNSMLFEVIEAAKEHLTEDNRPCGECAICLCNFNDDDVFTKTDCYHYFHSHCLARYSKIEPTETDENTSSPGEENAPDKELLCPVCRLPISFEGSEEDFPPPAHKDEEIVIGEDVLEIQKKMADLYQKQVDKGGIIDIEAEKNKYLLEISDVPSRSNEEAASSENLSKAEENAQNEVDSKDLNPDSKNPSKSTVSAEEKTKNDKKFNKQPRNKYPNRTNKKYDNSKPKYNKSDKERIQKDVSSPSKTVGKEEENSEENCDDENAASRPSGARSEANSYKRNERKNNYGPPRRHYDDDYERGNYYRYPDSRGGNRGRRFAPNGYDNRRNFRDHGYRGRGGRSYPERETSGEQNHQNESKGDDSVQDMAASKETTEPDVTDSPKRSAKFERDNSGRNRQYPQKKYSDGEYNKRESYSRNKPDARDSCPDRDSRMQRREEDDEYETREKDGNDRRSGDKYQGGSYRDRRNYSDIRLTYGDRDAQSQRRGGYDARDNSRRGSYGRTRNRGSFRNTTRRENSEENAQVEEGAKEEDCGNNDTEDRENRGSDNQKYQFSDRRSGHRGGRGNPRRNGNPYRQNNQHFNEKRDDYSNGFEDSRDKYSYPEGDTDVQVPLSHDKNEGSRDEDLVEESRPKRYSQRNYQEDNPRHYEDRRNYNSQRGGYRDYDRNRQNPDFPNFRNQRYSNDRPYRNKNDSYQYKNNSSRMYNSDQYPYTSNSTSKHVDRENSEHHSGENSSEKTVAEASSKATKPPGFSNEKEPFLSQEPSQSKAHQSESTTSKDTPSSMPVQLPASVKPQATFSSNSPKMLQPPPGFSNPLKKVVYGLQAANPPPGFPRS